MSDRASPASPRVELGARPTLLVVVGSIAFVLGGGAWGWSYAASMGALLGSVMGCALAILLFTLVRLVVGAKALGERSAPDVRTLAPDQALQVLGAFMGSSSGTGIEGGLVAELAKLRAMSARGDPRGALMRLDALERLHPHAAGIPAARAESLRSLGEIEQARAAASLAIRAAVRGGMNRIAVQCLLEVAESERPLLQLEPDLVDALVRALRVAGEGAAADALDQRRLPSASEREGPSP